MKTEKNSIKKLSYTEISVRKINVMTGILRRQPAK